jgi:hypothetical protein
MPEHSSYSPAALALMGAGVSLTAIAGALATTPTSVSRWLKGHYPAPSELWVVIAALGGRDLAERVRSLVPSRAEVPS